MSYNPLPQTSDKIQLLGLGLVVHFACSPWKWVIATTCGCVCMCGFKY